MKIELETEFAESSGTIIKVIGVGGAGCNAINRMAKEDIAGCHLIAANTDMQSLANSKAHQCLQIGTRTTRGLGAGADPAIGRKAAEEQRNLIEKALAGADMVFITAGMGGGTGTGAAPVVAEVAKKLGCLTVAVVTRPFHFEMTERMQVAEQGIAVLTKCVDTLIVIPNENLLSYSEAQLSVQQAFAEADNVLMQGVRGVSNLILQTGFINVDFADVCAVMKNRGNAMMSLAVIGSDDDDETLLAKVLDNPLVEGRGIRGAHGLLINIEYGKKALMKNVAHVVTLIASQADPKARCIQGLTPMDEGEKEMHITVIATGFKQLNHTDSFDMPAQGSASDEDQENYPANKIQRTNAVRNRSEAVARTHTNNQPQPTHTRATNNKSALEEILQANYNAKLNLEEQNKNGIRKARESLNATNYNFLEDEEKEKLRDSFNTTNDVARQNHTPTTKLWQNLPLEKEKIQNPTPSSLNYDVGTRPANEIAPQDSTLHDIAKTSLINSKKNIHTFATDPIMKREIPDIFQQNDAGLPLAQGNSGKEVLGGNGKDKKKMSDLEKPAFLRAGKKIDFF